jgi:hypothetical protein
MQWKNGIFPIFIPEQKLALRYSRNRPNQKQVQPRRLQRNHRPENEVMIKAFEQQVQFVPGIVPVLKRLCNYSFTKYGIKEPIITSRKHDYNRIRTWYFNNTYKGMAKPIIHETKEPVIIVQKNDSNKTIYTDL